MMGRSHAISAAAAWAWAAPYFGVHEAIPLAGTLILAAGAGVIPDIDHPDARPARQFGMLGKFVAKMTAKAAGGHRKATHSIPFAVAVGGVLWAADSFGWGEVSWRSAAGGLIAFFLATVGFSLTAPSLGLRTPGWLALLVGAGLGVWVWQQPSLVWMPPLLTLGILIHIVGDWLTKGGVPLFLPFTKRRWKAGLFRTGSKAESFVAALCWVALAAGLWNFAGLPFPTVGI